MSEFSITEILNFYSWLFTDIVCEKNRFLKVLIKYIHVFGIV
jgi:hypothetical protein